METTTSTKGKGLGIAGMVIGIVAFVWAIIPGVGALAWWLAAVGVILSIVAIFMARSGKNPKKGVMITGMVLNVLAIAAAAYWIYQLMQIGNAALEGFEAGLNSIK